MAYRPSKRTLHGREEFHANITPMMNLMVVLIPLLLTSAEFVKLGVIELNLPPSAEGIEGELLSELPQEEIKRLDLNVTIKEDGFYISSSERKLGDGPTIPIKDGAYDFERLSQILLEEKERAENQYPDINQIVIIAKPLIDYQTLVSTMDASRMIEVEDVIKILFPEVSLSAAIL